MDKYLKAIAAFLLAAYTAYNAARLGTSPGGDGVTADEWIGLIVTGATVGFGVYAVPNKTETPYNPEHGE